MNIIHVNKQNKIVIIFTYLNAHFFNILYIIVLYIMNEHTKKYYLNRLTNQCQERTSDREQHKPVLEHSSWLNDLL